ncbi:Decarboxylase [Hyphomicrobiales bacterium]|nr:Decarboxylase [Hyphomicrobiales bacterium]CAH1693243.1 Decarboxylase [Hyphomicrobiales bacterium]
MELATATAAQSWQKAMASAFKRNEVKLATYVPDRVLTPIITELTEDPFFKTFCATREEEAVGIVSGAWLGGLRGVALMQTSGLATLPNVLASLCVPYQLPTILVISERGTLGEFNIGQVLVCRTLRPTLDSLGIEHHTLRHSADVDFIVDRGIKQAIGTQAPVAFILNPQLTATTATGKGH